MSFDKQFLQMGLTLGLVIILSGCLEESDAPQENESIADSTPNPIVDTSPDPIVDPVPDPIVDPTPDPIVQPDDNSPPVASNVVIIDSNGGDVEVGDTLIGNYSYVDTDNDIEGGSVFGWLRNGTTISGATAQNYEVVTGDIGTEIIFGVTPTAQTGQTIGLSVRSMGITPQEAVGPVDYDVDSKDLFVELPSHGSVRVTLHPGATVTVGAETTVPFGLPFPRAVVADLSDIKVIDDSGVEIASHVEETARWKSLSSDSDTISDADSIRSVLIYVDVVFDNLDPVTLDVYYGATRTLELGAQADVKTTWVSISEGGFPLEYPEVDDIKEPAVYVTLPSTWMAVSLLSSRTLPKDSDPQSNLNLHWFDDAYENFSYSAVNDVSESVTDEWLIDYVGIEGLGPDTSTDGYEPWLFDRTMTLFGIYTQTGNVKWLRHAHRAAQFYAKHISEDGYFDKKPTKDLKYGYGQSLFVDLMLTGDTDMVEVIERIATTSDSWNETYTYVLDKTSLWTERHQAYALLSVLTAWEATGSSVYADRIEVIVNASTNMLLNPQNNWNQEGCLLHTYAVHEWNSPDYGDLPICSPWMSAFLADAMMRYYIHSEDERALVLLSNLGEFITNYGVYVSDLGDYTGFLMPYYLASSEHQVKVNSGWDDFRHACDVAGVSAKGAWAKDRLGENADALVTTTNLLLETCDLNLDNLHRPDADINYGKTIWRLAPARSYSWNFVSTIDMRWMLNSLVPIE